jgi:uncharacterized protein involved in exopolysaccharide biosynthesis
MNDIDKSNVLVPRDDELDLKEILLALKNDKWIIVSITTFISIIGVIYSLLLPDIYQSRALLVSSSPNNQSGLSQSYSSLASLAGVEILEDSESNSIQALEKLKSLSFFENDFLPYIFLPDLMAFNFWNSKSNTTEYDERIYDNVSNTWIKKSIPSVQESFDKFIKHHLSIETDNKTSFVTVEIKHKSPYIAKEWTNLLIDQINDFYRKKDKDEAERASNYLNTLLVKTNLSEIKEVIAKLIQQETQKLTLIEANEFYVYEFIDPPAVMEKKSEPNRILICILSVFFSLIISFMSVLFRYYFLKRN